MLLQVWVLLVLHTAFTYSKVSPVNERCVTAVYTACGYIPFATSPEAARGFWGSRCQNPWTVTSIYAAADVYCDASERTAGFAQLQSSCLQFGHVDLIPRDALAANLTKDAINQMRRVDYGEIPGSGPVDYPVLLSASFYHRTFRTINTWEFEVWTHSAYGLAGYLFWAVILSIGVFHRLIQHILLSKRIRVNGNRSVLSRTLYTPFITIYHWIQTYIITSSPLPSGGRYLLWWTFPTRIEAILVVLFWVLSAVLSSVSYRLFPENIYWPQISAQLLRYIADRTGILSFANIPLIWLFAGRNNVFIWATGWSFATFNLFHRHIAWIATIQAVVHTLLYVVLFMQNGNPWKKLVRKPYLIWGTIGMVAMILLCPFAIDWFRRRTYETFLVLHILFSVAALVGCFYHTIIFEDYEYWIWLWPAVGFWATDRLLRVVRLVYYNLHVRTNVGKSIQYTRSSATYDEASDVIRLEVIPGSSRLQPTPGQYYYLYQPFRLTGWENHPFTLGAWSYETGPLTSQTPTPLLAKGDDTVDVTQVPLLSDSSSGSRTPPENVPSLDKSQRLRLVFWIRPFDGWTRHLRQQCIKSHGRTLDTTILLEGPYGEQFPLWEYESILLIAGGTGIAAAVPYIQDHLARCATDEVESPTRIRNIHLVWTSRQEAFVREVATRELSSALARDDFRASFYVTSATAAGGLDECSTLCEELSGKAIEVGHGRPDLQALVLGHAHEAQLSDCSAAVLMCGPPAMADEVRTAVYQTMRQGYQGVRYIEESFSW